MIEMAVWKVGSEIISEGLLSMVQGRQSCPGPLLSSILFLNYLSDW